MTGSLPKRYAKALIAIAKEEDRVQEYGEHLAQLTALLEKSPEAPALSNDLFDSEGRSNAVGEIAEAIGCPPLLKNFLLLLVRKERIGLLPAIAREYRRMEDEILGVVRVRVKTPAAADPTLLARVEKVLTRHLRKKIIADGEARPEIIGGLVLEIGHTIYDGSIKRELERLRESIL